MRSATTSQLLCRRGRPCLLALLVCSSMTSTAALAQAETAARDATEVAASPVDTDAATAAAVATSATAPDDVASNEQFVTGTLAQFGRRSMQTAEAYVGLADAQRQAKEYEKAAESYLVAVEVYREIDGPFTPLTIAPLTSLGDNYYEANDNSSAVSAYTEARTVSRRVFGLHNEDQVVFLDRLSRSLLDLDQLTEADEQQQEALRLVQRSNAPDSDAVLEGIYKYAAWLGQRMMFQLQRDQYTRAIRIIRDSYGERDLRLVTPLLGIGNAYRQERNPVGMGLSVLEDALSILSEQPEQDPLAIAAALRDVGDWGVAFNAGDYNGAEYRRAWGLLGSVANGEELRDDWFTDANYVLYEPISSRGLSTDRDAKSGHVIASFDLDTRGNTSNVAIVESDPAGFKDEAVLRHIRRSRFRPLMSDGAFTAGQGLAIQFRFRYAETAVAPNDNKERR